MTDADNAGLRRDARKIFYAAIHAAEPGPLVHAALLNAPELYRHSRVHVLAVGKAATGMAAAALETLRDHVVSCLVIAPDDAVSPAADILAMPLVEVLAASHPLPDAASMHAAERALAMIHSTHPDDVIVALISGGASSLMALPVAGVSIEDYRATVALLLDAGVDINQLNTVRRQIDVVKGGGLARAALNRTVVGLVISDVVGNRLEMIGSGPFTVDTSTAADALHVLQRLDLVNRVPHAVVQYLTTCDADATDASYPSHGSIRMQIIADNGHALDAAATYARRLGYAVVRIADAVTGDAATAGSSLGAQIRAQPVPPVNTCMISGGETVVTVRGTGTGGRNQEMALAAAVAIDGVEGVLVLCAGTDGIDGPTVAAGGVVDGRTCERIRAAGLDPQLLLAANDSYRALAAADDLLLTGATGTNVLDVHLVLRRGSVDG